MKNPSKQVRLVLFSFLLCLIGTSCTNSDYDLNSMENLIGIGGDGLVIPSSSTDTLKLGDVLEVNNGDCIKLDADSNYVLQISGGDAKVVKPNIANFSINPPSNDLTTSAFPVLFKETVYNLPDKEIFNFDYSGTKPSEIVEILKASLNDSYITLSMVFSGMSDVSKIDKISFTLPDYMDAELASVSNGTATITGSTINWADVPPQGTQNLKIHIKDLDFSTNPLGKNSTTLNVNCAINLSMNATNLPVRTGVGTITAKAQISNLAVNSATGYFQPIIDLKDFGKAEINSVPEYLRDSSVNVDLANPQINLTVNNNMDVQGIISGTIGAYKNGALTKEVKVANMKLKSNGITKASICRVAGSDATTDYYPQLDLSELIKTIPDYVTFKGSVNADDTYKSTFKLGNDAGNEVKLAYEINAPLAFSDNAHIVYKDTTNNWNKDIKDYSLSKDAYVTVSSTIESRIPVYLNLSAKAVDVNKKVLNNIKVEVTYGDGNASLKASADGKTPAITPINIKLSETETGAIKQLDGLIITADAATQSNGAQTVKGITLNARNHSLIARDIIIKLVGKVEKTL